MKKPTKNSIVSWLLIGYFITWQIMTITYWIEFSNEHTFWETAFLGFFIAEL
tara:strand:+ start:1133 stop:1288 length:156 start_codon:yes stop_codon:yes gene_type:complete